MQIEIRKSAIKDLKQISEPYRTKIHNKILELKLPILNRKWDIVDKNGISTSEKNIKFDNEIINMYKNNISNTQISKLLNCSYSKVLTTVNKFKSFMK